MARCTGLLIIGVGLCLAASGTPAWAQARDQSEPTAGRNVVIWARDSGSGHRLMARHILDNGLPQRGSNAVWEATSPTLLDGATGDQRWPMLLDRFLVWSERSPGRADYDVYLQELDKVRFRPKGDPILVAGGPSDQIHPTLGGTCGELAVLWSDDRHDDGDIYLRWYNVANLEPRGPDLWVVDSPGWADEPFVDHGELAEHRLRILFTDDRNGNRDVYSTEIRDDPRSPVDPRANQAPVVTGPEDQYAPRVIRSNTQDLFLWTVDTLADGPDVVGQRLLGGLARGQPLVIAGGPGDQSGPTASTFGDGRWLVAWTVEVGGTHNVVGGLIRPNGYLEQRALELTADVTP